MSAERGSPYGFDHLDHVESGSSVSPVRTSKASSVPDGVSAVHERAPHFETNPASRTALVIVPFFEYPRLIWKRAPRLLVAAKTAPSRPTAKALICEASIVASSLASPAGVTERSFPLSPVPTRRRPPGIATRERGTLSRDSQIFRPYPAGEIRKMAPV